MGNSRLKKSDLLILKSNFMHIRYMQERLLPYWVCRFQKTKQNKNWQVDPILKCHLNMVNTVLFLRLTARLDLHINHWHYLVIIHFRLKSNMAIHVIKPQTWKVSKSSLVQNLLILQKNQSGSKEVNWLAQNAWWSQD